MTGWPRTPSVRLPCAHCRASHLFVASSGAAAHPSTCLCALCNVSVVNTRSQNTPLQLSAPRRPITGATTRKRRPCGTCARPEQTHEFKPVARTRVRRRIHRCVTVASVSGVVMPDLKRSRPAQAIMAPLSMQYLSERHHLHRLRRGETSIPAVHRADPSTAFGGHNGHHLLQPLVACAPFRVCHQDTRARATDIRRLQR